jgi:hypothetical protein
MLGSLLYVTTSRPYVMQVVGQVARFQAAPKESHVLAVKRIFRYLKGTKEFGLWYLLLLRSPPLPSYISHPIHPSKVSFVVSFLAYSPFLFFSWPPFGFAYLHHPCVS